MVDGWRSRTRGIDKFLELGSIFVGDNRTGNLMSARIDFATDRSHQSECDHLRAASNHVPVGHALGSYSFDTNIDREDIFEDRRGFVIARAMDAGPSVKGGPQVGLLLRKNRPPTVPEQGVFGLFHVNEKRREVDDTSSVGFSKLDASIPSKNRGVTRRHRA